MNAIIIILAVTVLVLLFLYIKKVSYGHNLTDKNVQLLLKSMPVTAIIYDEKLRVIKMVNPNQAFAFIGKDSIEGLTIDEIAQKYPIFKECSLFVEEKIKETLRNDKDVNFLYTIKGDNDVFYFDAKISLLNHNKVIFFSQDVTKRILAEKEIEELKNFFQSVVDNLPVGVFVKNIDDDYKTIFFNKKLLEFFDYDVYIENGHILSKKDDNERTLNKRMVEDCEVVKSGLPIVLPISVCDDEGVPYRYGLITKSKYSLSKDASFIIGTLVDTTNIKNNEIELENKQNEIIVALNAGNLSAWSYNVCDRKFTSVYGDTLSGESSSFEMLYDMLHSDSHDTFNHFMHSLLSKEVKTANAILRFKTKDGYRWFQTYASGIYSNTGALTQIIGTQKDITDDLRKQHELQESKFKLELAMDAAGVVMWDYDVEANTLSSPNPLSIVYDIDYSMDEYIDTFVLPEYRMLFKDVVRSLICDNLNDAEHVIKLKNFDGSIQWAQFTGRVILRGDDGKAQKIIGTRKFITESVEAANRIKEANFRTELVLKSNNIIQWDYDLEKKIFTYPDSDYLISKSITLDRYLSKIYEEDKQTLLNAFDKLATGEIQTMNLQLRLDTPDGIKWQEIDCVSFKYFEDGRVKTITGLRRDITDWKNMTNELIVLRNKAEESNRLKSAFLANMSHEIRTPLNAIIGFSNLITTCDDPVEKEEFCKVIETNNELLLQLINDILDLSKIEAGQLEFIYSEMDVTEMLESLAQVFKYKVKNGVELITKIPSEHCYICSERNRLTQVMFNFLSNASKFTERGSIIMGYEYVEGGLKFYVKDSGKGIAKENLPYVFDRFAKFDSFVQGTGLGLSICNTIVSKLNGEIFVESEMGAGSTFWFTIPCEILLEAPNYCDEYTEHKIDIEENSGKKLILIAEDNYSNYTLMSKLLSDNFEIMHANNGVEVVDMHLSYCPDLIFMDIKMPQMDGLEATRIIRDRDKHIPIIALTAHAYNNNRDEAIAAGCSEFMTKPVDKHQLNACINKFL